MTPRKGLALKGINYDTGTNYAGYLSREVWSHALIHQEISAIRHQLHCNAINIYGSDVNRIVECADAALQQKLHVWLQPRLIDSSPDEMLEHLSLLAITAENLRQQHHHITLNIGCELSIFMSGLIPGRSFLQRASWLNRMWWLWMLLPHYNKRLNTHLKHARGTARLHFKGHISYGAGIWEDIDWAEFDIVGLNYYRDASNQSRYVNDLRHFHQYGKPIVITEFGCCSFDGAERLGASGDSIVDYTKAIPQLKRIPHRNEKVQANYIVDLLNIYETESIYGAFVFEFVEPSHPHSSNRLYDLDIASYGIVKVELNSESDEVLHWKPKAAFHALARYYEQRNAQ
jgi:hypothetical protein